MRVLSVCFIGIGSIAKRHIRNLKILCRSRKINIYIDAVRRQGAAINEQISSIRTVFSDISELEIQYDIIFITNPTEFHMETLEKYHSYGKNFFIEKPISSVSQINLAETFKQRDDSVYYVACPLRYNSVIQYIKNNIDINKVFSVRSISSSYLPDWRIGVDYRETYSAHKCLGGGVDIDLVHEWDYLTYLFGFPSAVKWIHGKKSNLEIDSDDFAIYIAEYNDMTVELHLDYFGRSPIREIMIFAEDETVIGDLIKNEIIFLKKGKRIQFCEERDEYQRYELAFFLDSIDSGYVEGNTIVHAAKILKLTQGEL